MNYKTMALVVAVTLLSGCASIVSGVNQSLSVVANGDASQVMGARCSLTNDKGEWFTTTPGSVTVRRSYSNLVVSCGKGDSSGVAQVKSTTKAMAFGNILIGGVIGAGVDIGTGAAYDYPDLIAIQMHSASTGLPTPSPTSPASEPAQPPVAQPREPGAETPNTLSNSPPIGKDAHQAERVAGVNACNAQPRAVLSAKGPGFETYSIACTNGDSLAVRCEFGNCRVLR